MSNRKFNLDNDVQPEIHFRLLSISASKYENDWTSFPHSHHFTEIFFIKDGTGRMLIENESLPVSSFFLKNQKPSINGTTDSRIQYK